MPRARRRVAAACLPHLALAAAGRGEDRGVVAVLDDEDPRRPFTLRGVTRIVDASDDLRALGVRPPMRVLDAQRVAPALSVVTARRHAMERELASLAELLLACSPLVEPVPPSSILVDLAGLQKPTGALLDDVERELSAAGHRSFLAVSPGKRLSLALARELASRPERPSGSSRLVVDDDAVDEALRLLSLSALELPVELEEALAALGVRSAADLRRMLPRGAPARLQDEAARVLRLLDGRDEEPLSPLRPKPRIEEVVDLEHAVSSLEPLLFVLLPLCERACRRARARLCRIAGVELRLSGRDLPLVRLPFSFPDPLAEGRALLAALSARLSARGVPGPVGRARLVVTLLADGRPRQRDAFAPDALPSEAIGALLAEMQSELGAGAVGCLSVKPSLLPERMTELRWPAPKEAPRIERDPARLAAGGRFLVGWPWPVTLLDEPLPAATLPVRRVLRFGRLEGEDESDRPFVRDYVVLELADGRRALGLKDEELDEVLVQGWFD